jgi:urease accessory protein
MLIQAKKGNLQHINTNKKIDWLNLHWYETQKRVQRKLTVSGQEIALKFLQENPALTEGDILFEDEKSIVAVHILPCPCIVISPKSMFEMASVCYEIGNKHLPIFYDQEEILVPFEAPLFNLLQAQGYAIKQEDRQLLHPLKTTVTPHGNTENSLFAKILKFTAPNE